MHRRAFLGGAAAALAGSVGGCAAVDSALTGLGPGRPVSLVRTTTLPAPVPVDLTVSLAATRFGGGRAPELVVEAVNDADGPVGIGPWSGGGPMHARDTGPAGLRLLTDREFGSVTVAADDCPRTSFEPADPRAVPPADGYRVRKLAAGERTRRRYRLVGAVDALDGRCPPAGEYRFSAAVAAARFDDPPAATVTGGAFDDADPTVAEWGFTVGLPAVGGE